MHDALPGSPRRLASLEAASSRVPRFSASIQTKIFAYGLILPCVLLLLGLVAYPCFYAI